MEYQFGKYNDYYWVQSWDPGLDIMGIAEKAPHFFIGKYLAISAFDSGAVALSDEEVNSGWSIKSGIAYSPRLKDSFPFGLSHFGFDEWYILTNDTEITVCEIYVNYMEFNLEKSSNWKGFWDQIERIAPYAYISEGDQLTVVTRDKVLIDLLQTCI